MTLIFPVFIVPIQKFLVRKLDLTILQIEQTQKKMLFFKQNTASLLFIVSSTSANYGPSNKAALVSKCRLLGNTASCVDHRAEWCESIGKTHAAWAMNSCYSALRNLGRQRNLVIFFEVFRMIFDKKIQIFERTVRPKR